MFWQTLIATSLLGRSAAAGNSDSVIVVVGAPGTQEYGEQFAEWVERWKAAAQTASAEFVGIGQTSAPIPGNRPVDVGASTSDHDRLHEVLKDSATKESGVLWIVLIGHGTFDGETAKFNLRGPDVTAEELAEWLAPAKGNVVVVNCSSASAPFINRLSAARRVIVTATKSGDEQNFARFGDFISSAFSDLRADVDKDGQVSLLEAFLTASRQVQEFYDQDARLATEHALIDDNGDGMGTPAQGFRGIRAIRTPTVDAKLDGTRAHQLHLIASDRESRMPPEIRAKRDALEAQIADLRDEKDRLDESDYYDRLEPILIELGKLYAKSDDKIPLP